MRAGVSCHTDDKRSRSERRVSGNAGVQVQFSEENSALKVASNIRLRHITTEISVNVRFIGWVRLG